MAVETALYPTQLVATLPEGGDPQGEGDDHLRLLKVVLKTTFPNLTSPVDLTPAQLNAMSDATRLIPSGLTVGWSGSIASIPAGWKLCNGVGTTSNGIPVPDFRDKFVLGAGGAYADGSTGGSTTHNHGATLTITPHAITEAQMPSHAHAAAYVYLNAVTRGNGRTGSGNLAYFSLPAPQNSTPTGGGQAHTHGATATVASGSNLPPYYAMAIIVKD